MSWGLVAGAAIGAIGTGIAAKKQSKAADKATAAQVQASDQQIDFARESRDLARQDVEPYRQAGYTALDALMSMTGLATPKSQQSAQGSPELLRSSPGFLRNQALRNNPGRSLGFLRKQAAREGNWELASALAPGRGSAFGGPRGGMGRIRGRMHGGALYNINEMGPESVYEGGTYTRSSEPKTIPPSDGYVAPNIQGRVFGGFIPEKYGRGDFINSNLANKEAVKFGGATSPVWRGNAAASGGGVQVLPAQESRTMAGPTENPGGVEGGFNFMTDPGYGFRFGEGQRALERGAAARGGLLSGGTARKLVRYGQDYASNEYTNVYNRIANIAGLGQVSAGQAGNAALLTGQQMGGAASNAGFARASGYTAQGNIWGNAINQVAQLPWGKIFNRSRGNPGWEGWDPSSQGS